MTQWIDQENDPAPQWVGDMAWREVNAARTYYQADWKYHDSAFKALCRRIYRTETPPVDPDFERMRRALVAFERAQANTFAADLIECGSYSYEIQAALDAWNETVAS